MSHAGYLPKDWGVVGGKARSPGTETEDVFVFPASYPQQRLWTLDALDPGHGIFNMPEAFRIVGPLNVPVLEKAIEEIACRHEILRTTFGAAESLPVQIVFPAKPLHFPALDLRILDLEKRHAEAERLIEEEIQAPFNLEKGPLFRVRLLCLDAFEHILLINCHSIITDAGSREVFERELGALYQAFSAGLPSPLPELPIQYGDFAEWQRAAVQSEEMTRQLAYWKARLRAAPALELPTDRPRPSVPGFEGATEWFELAGPLVEGLRALGKEQGFSLFTTVLAGFHTLLSAYSGQEDIVIGSPLANRGQPGVEALIGLFANTILFRNDMSGDPRFSEFLVRVSATVLGAFENQDLPCEVLADELHPNAVAGRNPLCRVQFAFRPASSSERVMADLALSPIDMGSRTANFDLTLSLFERAGGIKGFLNYDADLFDAERIRRFAADFSAVLEAVVAAPNARISELPLPRTASASPAREGDCVPARGWMQERLVEIWEDVLKVRPVGITDDFFKLGGNTRLATAMCMRVEKIMGRKLPPETLSENATISQLSDFFAMTKVQSEGTKQPFFFLHGDYLDGGLYCMNLVRHMAKDRPFYKIDPDGWDGRATPATVEAMAASRLEILLKRQKKGPYFLGGYCNGGLVAFEMARLLEERGEKVACLVLVVVDAINVPLRPLLAAVNLWGGVCGMNERARQELFLKWRQAYLFACASFGHHAAALRTVLQEDDASDALGRLGRKSARVFSRLANMMTPGGADVAPPAVESGGDLARAYRDAVCSYMPRRYNGKAFLLPESEPTPDARSTDPTFNWKTVVKRLTVRPVPGGHFTAISVYSNLIVLTERLQACLDEAEAESRSGDQA